MTKIPPFLKIELHSSYMPQKKGKIIRAGARSKTLGWRQQTKSQNIGVAAGVAANEKSKYWGGSCHPCHPSSTGPVISKTCRGLK